jgi:hypothetical protein
VGWPADHPHGFAEIDATGDTRLFRRCKKSHIKDGEIGFWLFKNGHDGMMSVDTERCRTEEEEVATVEPTKWGLVVFAARAASAVGQVIVYWPEDDNLAHSQVVGEKTGRIQRGLAASASLLLAPSID